MAKMVNICDVCSEIFAGGDAPKNNMSIVQTDEYNVPIYSNGEANDGLYGFTNFARVSEPSITISARGTIGYTSIRNTPFVPIVRLITLVPKKDVIDIRYLFYAAQNYHFDGSGTSIPQLTVPALKKYNFPLPTIAEQKKIVVVLDKICDLITLRKQQLLRLDELVKSRFIELFGDPVDNPKNYLVKSLQELIDMGYITYHLDGNHGGDYPRSEEFVDSGVPYIGANSIVNGKIDFSMAKFLTAERAGKLRKGIAQNDDVLFAHNATVGPTVVLKTTEPKVILSTSLTAYRCDKSRLLPNYLKAYMQSDGFVRQYSGEMKQTTRNQVPITAQKKYLFLVPPIVEQKQFAVFVEQTDKSKLAIQKSLDVLEILKKSLMQKYFG